jgi:hypothetical protein
MPTRLGGWRYGIRCVGVHNLVVALCRFLGAGIVGSSYSASQMLTKWL